MDANVAVHYLGDLKVHTQAHDVDGLHHDKWIREMDQERCKTASC